jgi:hypothetical protein
MTDAWNITNKVSYFKYHIAFFSRKNHLLEAMALAVPGRGSRDKSGNVRLELDYRAKRAYMAGSFLFCHLFSREERDPSQSKPGTVTAQGFTRGWGIS